MNDLPDGRHRPTKVEAVAADLAAKVAHDATVIKGAVKDADRDLRATAAQQVEDLIAANVTSNNTMLSLIEKVQEDARLRGMKVELLDEEARQTRKQILIASLGIVLMVIIGVANAININSARHNAAVTAAAARDANSTNTLLLDCINPQGVCGKAGAENQRHLLDEIKKYELIVLYCVRINPALADPKGEAFIACVNRLYPGGPQLPNG